MDGYNINYAFNYFISSSPFSIILVPFIILIITGAIRAILARKKYEESDYYAATKTPYHVMRRDSGI